MNQGEAFEALLMGKAMKVQNFILAILEDKRHSALVVA